MISNQFAKDVTEGLSSFPKTLPSKYFYDAIGDELFIKIMALPEYYLTRAEMEIFKEQTQQLTTSLGQDKSRHFELIELGAGDGQKTFYLLKELLNSGYKFTYIPVDISANVLAQLEENLQTRLPNLSITPKAGDYFQQLEILEKDLAPRVVLYLGSNLGNLTDKKSANFMQQMAERLKQKDRMILGVDRIKSADIVLPAYNDPAGVTAAFNLNLLARINRELGGNFEVSNFRHTPTYSEETGIAKSYLESLCNQRVLIESLNTTFEFQQGEKILTEISRKYDLNIIQAIIDETSFEILETFSDSREHFLDVILEYQ